MEPSRSLLLAGQCQPSAVLAAMGTTQHGGHSAGARRCSRRGAAVPLMVIAGEEDTAVACSAGGFMVGNLMEQQSAWNQ